jgi:hypothetical protein
MRTIVSDYVDEAKLCWACSKWFTGRANARYCSEACQVAAKRKRFAAGRRDMAIGYVRFSMRCWHCNGRFRALRQSRKFCSDACRQAAHRKRANPVETPSSSSDTC